MNPNAQPYAFPTADNPELAAYLTAKTEHDPATGCLLWTGGLLRGEPRLWKTHAARYGSDRPARLAWQLGHGTELDRGAKLVSTCGNPKCINPDHLRLALPAIPKRVRHAGNGEGEMPAPRWAATGGVIMVGNRQLDAARVYDWQSRPPPRDPSLGLIWVFRHDIALLGTPSSPLLYHQRAKLEIIRAVRRCAVRASCTVLPCGFTRYDLPPGVHKIAFTELPPQSYGDAFGWIDGDDNGPRIAPEATWAKAA